MKAFEFQANVGPGGTLLLPPDLQAQVRPDQPVRVLLLVSEPEGDAAWAELTAEQFLKGYDPSDAIYNNLQPR